MLSSQNDGKYFTKKWAKERADAIIDNDAFDSDELSHLEVTSQDSAKDPETYKLEKVSALDKYPGSYDKRKLPKYGGR